MRHVSDAFLLNMAEVSSTLIGLFLVGVFFYIETGIRRLDHARRVFESYLRAGTRITLIVSLRSPSAFRSPWSPWSRSTPGYSSPS